MIINNKARLKRAFALAARWRQPWLAARLLHLTTKPISQPQASSHPRRYCALVLSVKKAGFLEDVEDAFVGTNDFDLIAWPTFALRAFANAILSSSLHNNSYFTNDPDIEASKANYRNFLIRTWKHFCAIRPTHAVLSSNFHYFVQREFAAALEEAGTPFIVLHKENLKSPGRAEFWRYRYKKRGRFAGRKILAYNDIERDLQISADIIDPNKVLVTGMPRIDRVHRWRREHAGPANGHDHPQVLFFAFDKKDKLPSGQHRRAEGTLGNLPEIAKRWGDLTWNSFCEGTHRAIVELARKRPDLRVVVKVKGVQRQRTEVDQMLRANGEDLPPNLEIVKGGDPFGLLIESQLVIGFNTTGLLEAIAAGKPVIVPHFGEALEPRTREFAIDLGDAVEYARSPDEIVALACRIIDSRKPIPLELSQGAARALRQWTGNDDGGAGLRVLEAVRSELPGAATEAASTPSALSA